MTQEPDTPGAHIVRVQDGGETMSKGPDALEAFALTRIRRRKEEAEEVVP